MNDCEESAVIVPGVPDGHILEIKPPEEYTIIVKERMGKCVRFTVSPGQECRIYIAKKKAKAGKDK